MDWNITVDELMTSYILLGSKFVVDGDKQTVRKMRIRNILHRGFCFEPEGVVFHAPIPMDELY